VGEIVRIAISSLPIPLQIYELRQIDGSILLCPVTRPFYCNKDASSVNIPGRILAFDNVGGYITMAAWQDHITIVKYADLLANHENVQCLHLQADGLIWSMCFLRETSNVLQLLVLTLLQGTFAYVNKSENQPRLHLFEWKLENSIKDHTQVILPLPFSMSKPMFLQQLADSSGVVVVLVSLAVAAPNLGKLCIIDYIK
jgi:hypothetical protein